VARHRAGHQQQVGVAGTRDELDAEPLEVVVGIIERIDLELARIAGTGVDMTDGERAREMFEDIGLQPLRSDTQRLVGLRGRFGLDPRDSNLLQ